MKKHLLQLVNNERTKVRITSKKGCDITAYDSCPGQSTDRASCGTYAYDKCTIEDNAACQEGADDYCGKDNHACIGPGVED